MTIETRTDFEPVEIEQTYEGVGWSETVTSYETQSVDTEVIVCDINIPGCDHDIGPKDSPAEHAILAANPDLDMRGYPDPADIIDEFRIRVENRGRTLEYRGGAPSTEIDAGDGWVFEATYRDAFGRGGGHGAAAFGRHDSDTVEKDIPTKTIYFDNELLDVAESAAMDVVPFTKPTTVADTQLHVCASCADQLGIECSRGHGEIDTRDSDSGSDAESESSTLAQHDDRVGVAHWYGFAIGLLLFGGCFFTVFVSAISLTAGSLLGALSLILTALFLADLIGNQSLYNAGE